MARCLLIAAIAAGAAHAAPRWEVLGNIDACLAADEQEFIRDLWAMSARSYCTIESAKATCEEHGSDPSRGCVLFVRGFNDAGTGAGAECYFLTQRMVDACKARLGGTLAGPNSDRATGYLLAPRRDAQELCDADGSGCNRFLGPADASTVIAHWLYSPSAWQRNAFPAFPQRALIIPNVAKEFSGAVRLSGMGSARGLRVTGGGSLQIGGDGSLNLGPNVCDPTQHESTPPSATAARTCVDNVVCVPGQQYEEAARSKLADRICRDLTVCEGHEYESKAPSLTSDRDCATHADCTPGQFELVAPSTTSDRKCQGITKCAAVGIEWEAATYTLTSNRDCRTVRDCEVNEWQAAAPTLSSDRDCRAHTTCADGQYEHAAPLGTNQDRQCRSVAVCAATEYIRATETPTSNRECSACPAGHACDGGAHPVPCGAGTFAALGDGVCNSCAEATFAIWGAAVCTPWRTCPAGEAQSMAGSRTADRACKPCNAGITYSASVTTTQSCDDVETCSVTEQETAAPTASSNRQCAACPAGHRCDGGNIATPCSAGTAAAHGEGSCAPCAAGHFAFANSALCGVCPERTFVGSGAGTSAAACMPWRLCQIGEGQNKSPTQAEDRQCVLCVEGHTFSSATDGHPCANATICEPSEWESAAPTISSDRDCSTHLALCPDGQYTHAPPTGTSDRVCHALRICSDPTEYETAAAGASSNRECGDCPAGHSCNGGATPTPCAHGTFARAGTGVCRAWRTCPAGMGQLMAGSYTEDRVCAACVVGSTFSSQDDGAPCAAVRTCTSDEHEIKPPSASSDRTCSACPAGHSCDGGAEAVPCGAGWAAAHAVGSCSRCSAGHYAVQASSSCTPCAPNEFAPAGSVSVAACKAWRTCPVTQGQRVAPSSGTDRECTACTKGVNWSDADNGEPCSALTQCVNGEWESAAPTISSDRDCSTHLALCPDGQYTHAPPTGTSDRVCHALRICSDPTEYETAAAGASSNRECGDCPAGHSCNGGATPTPCAHGTFARAGTGVCRAWRTCPAGMGQLMAGSYTEDRVCAACVVGSTFSSQDDGAPCAAVRTCIDGVQYEAAAPTATANRLCQKLSTCGTNQWVSAQPTKTSDRKCAEWTTCGAKQWEELEPSSERDRACTDWSVCNTTSYEVREPSPQRDRICRPLSVCSDGEYEKMPPTVTSDRICATHTECDAWQFILAAATSTSDRECRNIAPFCGPYQWQVAHPTTTSDRVCKDHTVCTQTQWASARPGLFTDRICSPLTTCTEFEYQSVAPTHMSYVHWFPPHDRECSPISPPCSTTQMELFAATYTSDRVCADLTQCPSEWGVYELTAPVSIVRTYSRRATGEAPSHAVITQDRVCAMLSECTAHEWQSAPLTGTDDRKCTPLTRCNATQWISATHSSFSDRECTAHPVCSSDSEWEEAPATESTARVCTPLTSCTPSEWEDTAPTATSDRSCTKLTVCGSSEWQDVPPTATSDRTCAPLTTCRSNEFETLAPGQSTGKHHDRQCQQHQNCGPGKHILTGAGALQDRTCGDCAAGFYQPSENAASCLSCPSGKHQTEAAAYLCVDDTVCTDFEHEVSPPTRIADRVCSSHQLCGAHQWISKAATDTEDRHCADLTQCSELEFEYTAPKMQSFASATATVQHAVTNRICKLKGCAPGSYIGDNETCEQCALGRYKSCDNTCGWVACTKCAEGRYAPAVGANACTLCPAGQYQYEMEKSTCISCSDGHISIAGVAACTKCPAGRHSNLAHTQCELCSKGHYSSAGSASCSACAEGRYANTLGSSACEDCNEGRYAARAAQATCNACSIGKYSSAKAAVDCAECDATVGLYQDEQSQAGCKDVRACPAGTRRFGSHISSEGICEKCAAGRFKAEKGQWHTQCDKCIQGQFAAGHGMTQCTLCDAGRYQPSVGSTTCLDCPTARYNAQVGRTSLSHCLDCPAGKFSAAVAQSACALCSKGTFGHVDKAQNASTHCVACPSGKFQVADGKHECAQCASGQYQHKPEQTSCHSCLEENLPFTGGKLSELRYFWTANQAGAKSCVAHPLDCKPGSWGSFETCTKSCGVGQQTRTRPIIYEAWGGGKACGAFSWNFTQDCNTHACPIDCIPSDWTAWTTCTKSCGTGTQSRSRSIVRDVAQGGKACPTLDASRSCNEHPCPIDCDVADWGSWDTCDADCNTGEQRRTRTHVQPKHGGKACPAERDVRKCNRQCCPGWFHVSNVACQQCAAGQYMPSQAAQACTPCPKGHVQSAIGQAQCEPCAHGTYNPLLGQTSHALHCLACEPGKYQPSLGSPACETCPMGRFTGLARRTHLDHCELCPAGKYAASPGTAQCQGCVQGQYQEGAGHSKCIECKLGHFSSVKNATSSNVCRACPCGKWAHGTGANVCAHCEVGKYFAGTMASSPSVCEKSTPGRFVASGGSCSATKCAAGKYQQQHGQAGCQVCSAGKYSLTVGAVTETTCKVCPAGKWSVASSVTCTACEVGKFAALPGRPSSAFCVTCDTGTYAPSEGSASCTQCEPGKYQDEEGKDHCLLCSVGRASAATAADSATACAPCAKGRFQPAVAQTSCSACHIGKYQDAEGQGTCISCPKGTSNALQAQIERSRCIACPDGKYADTLASATCTNCAVGKFGSNIVTIDTGGTTEAVCEYCSAGHYADVEALPVCKACSEGHFGHGAPQIGATSHAVHCLHCPAGKYQEADGKANCVECESGRYNQAHHDKVDCHDCPIYDTVRKQDTKGLAGQTRCWDVPLDCKQSGWGASVATDFKNDYTAELGEEVRTAMTQSQREIESHMRAAGLGVMQRATIATLEAEAAALLAQGRLTEAVAKHREALRVPSQHWFVAEDYSWDANWSARLRHENLSDPHKPVPEGWSEAQRWSQCTLSCGGGHHSRTRHPVRQPPLPAQCGSWPGKQGDEDCLEGWGGGKTCNDPSFTWEESEVCNAAPCPVDCVVSMWGHYSGCDKTCGKGSATRHRAVVSRNKFGGKHCPALVQTESCNHHSCGWEYMPGCHLEHVRCHVKLVSHHNSWFKRRELPKCAGTASERPITADDACWNTNSCPADGHTNNCHAPDTQEEIDMGNRLGAKPIPTIVVTHDRINMERLGHFHCKRHGNNCECTCDKHPLCCAHKGFVLENAMLFANRLTEVDSVQACCNLCTNHPACRAWEYDSKQVCILKSGKPKFITKPVTVEADTWAGLRSGSTESAGAELECDSEASTGEVPCKKRIGDVCVKWLQAYKPQ